LLRAVDSDLGEIEADDPVEGVDCFAAEEAEHASSDPFVATGSQGRIGDFVMEDRFDVSPR